MDPACTGVFADCIKVNRSYNANSDGNQMTITTLDFNAANSNIIYGAAQTVQPPAIALIPQIKF